MALGLLLGLVCRLSPLWAQQGAAGPPPVSVSVASVRGGQIAPQAEFTGTVFFQEVSDVASELDGLVDTVKFEEGQRVKKGQILVELGSDLLRKRLEATSASYQQVLADLEVARIDLQRSEKLYQKRSISAQSYDENRFRVKGLEKHAASLRADVERIEIELDKKIIRAPFDGVVINRRVDRGEWISEGETVAVVAKNDVVDIVVQIPEKYVRFVEVGMPVPVAVDTQTMQGSVIALVPRGDIATRTFPVKIRTQNTSSLIEGMSAGITLPIAEPQKALIVPRDAVISMFGRNVIFTVDDASQARMVPVTVVGYDGMNAGVDGPGLAEGMKVVVKGNERLRDGQMVAVAE